MKNKASVNDVQIFGKSLTRKEIKKNLYDKAINVYSLDNLVGKKIKLYDLMKEDGSKLTITSKTTEEEVKKFKNGEKTFHYQFYNQVNQDEEPIKIYGMPYSEE